MKSRAELIKILQLAAEDRRNLFINNLKYNMPVPLPQDSYLVGRITVCCELLGDASYSPVSFELVLTPEPEPPVVCATSDEPASYQPRPRSPFTNTSISEKAV